MVKLPADPQASLISKLPSHPRKVPRKFPLQSLILEINSGTRIKSTEDRKRKCGKTVVIVLFRYQLALAQNPRSITLWRNYLSWLKKEICKSDPGYLRKEHDKAMKIIGNHYKAGFIFENAFNLE